MPVGESAARRVRVLEGKLQALEVQRGQVLVDVRDVVTSTCNELVRKQVLLPANLFSNNCRYNQ